MKPQVLIGAAIFVSAAAFAQPTIRFDPYQVIAEGVTPGGEAAWLSVAREAGSWAETVVAAAELVRDEDGDGAVERVLEKECAATKSRWVVVDLTTGAFAFAAPGGYEPLPTKPPEWDRLDLSLLFDPRESLELLVVRPGVGAWRGSLREGAASDAEGTDDGLLAVFLPELEPLGVPKGAVAGLRPGDVVAGIDPTTLEFYVLAMTSEVLGL